MLEMCFGLSDQHTHLKVKPHLHLVLKEQFNTFFRESDEKADITLHVCALTQSWSQEAVSLA